MTDCREEFKQLLESTYVSSMWNKGRIYSEMMSFLEKVISFIPNSLFRYRSFDNDGYTVASFEKGTISLCKAMCFSDKYDSLVYVDVEKERALMEDGFKKGLQRVFESIRQKDPSLRAERATKLCYYLEQGMTEQEAIEMILKEDYSGYLNEVERDLKQRETRFRDSEKTAKIACFTESVQSKFMWDTYADGYRGFALEYNLRELLISFINKGKPAYVFPIIYTDERPDLTTDEANFYVISKAYERGHIKQLAPLRPFLNSNLLAPHKPFLYKDKEEYGHEKEWRILYYNEESREDYIEIPDEGYLKAIYYGMDIRQDDYEKLHQIALNRGIKEYTVAIDNHSRKYSLKIAPHLTQEK